mgnify:CR=1 FL=1
MQEPKGFGSTGQPKSPEHRRKISEALKQYANQPDAHLHDLHRGGQDHPGWRGGIQPRYYRRIAFEAHGQVCARCGAVPPKRIVVHHRDEDRRNNDLSNLEVLCMTCHLKHHRSGG